MKWIIAPSGGSCEPIFPPMVDPDAEKVEKEDYEYPHPLYGVICVKAN